MLYVNFILIHEYIIFLMNGAMGNYHHSRRDAGVERFVDLDDGDLRSFCILLIDLC